MYEQLMATFNRVIQTRRSTRIFSGRPIKDSVMKMIIEAATLAPSFNNSQNWKFHILNYKKNIVPVADVVEKKTRELLEGLPEKYINEKVGEMTLFKKAPTVVFVFNDELVFKDEKFMEILENKGISKEQYLKLSASPDILGLGAAIENLLLKANELYIGACWMTAPLIFKKDITKALGLPDSWELMSIIPMGEEGGYFPPMKYVKTVDEVLTIEGKVE